MAANPAKLSTITQDEATELAAKALAGWHDDTDGEDHPRWMAYLSEAGRVLAAIEYERLGGEVDARRVAMHQIYWANTSPAIDRICTEVYGRFGGAYADSAGPDAIDPQEEAE